MRAGLRSPWPAVATWLILAAIATAAGVVRQLLLPELSVSSARTSSGRCRCPPSLLEPSARSSSGRKPSVRHAAIVGVSWLGAAVLFEFGLGHWLDGLSWARLLSDYDLRQGRRSLLVWLTVAVGPAAWAAVVARRP